MGDARIGIVFIPTTWQKFVNAEQLNDLFDESPLEDILWDSFKSAQIPAERQWTERVEKIIYQLDFAIFCDEGRIDVEADGDTWHAQRDRIKLDNERNNALEKNGWHILRFNGKQINDEKAKYCLRGVEATINRLGGLTEDGLVPRKFYPKADGVQQLSLFESKAEYNVDEYDGEID